MLHVSISTCEIVREDGKVFGHMLAPIGRSKPPPEWGSRVGAVYLFAWEQMSSARLFA